MKRCPWCENDELYVTYHDEEWGVPLAGSSPRSFVELMGMVFLVYICKIGFDESIC